MIKLKDTGISRLEKIANTDIRVFLRLAAMIDPSNNIELSSVRRQRMVNELHINSQSLTNSLRRLRVAGLLDGAYGSYSIPKDVL